MLRHRLDHIVDVHRDTTRMGPQTVVDLISVNDILRDLRRAPKERPELDGLALREVGDRSHMPLRFDDQGAKAEWSDAVLDKPKRAAVDQTSWKGTLPVREFTGDAVDHDVGLPPEPDGRDVRAGNTNVRRVVEMLMTVRAIWNGTVVAESDRTILVEGNHYFPVEDVTTDLLES